MENYLLNKPNGLAEYHKKWAGKLKSDNTITEENVEEVIQEGVGSVFLRVLEDAGVFKETTDGKAAFKRFIETL